MVLICRHGQTEWNREGRLQWSKDSPLTQVWITQWIRVWDILKDIYPQADKIHSSPKPRAHTTAKIIANTLNVPRENIVIHDLLREMSFWTHEWMHKNDRRIWKYAEQIQARSENPYKTALPEWENYTQVRERAQEFVDTTPLELWDIIVAHEAFNRMLLGILWGLSENDALNIW